MPNLRLPLTKPEAVALSLLLAAAVDAGSAYAEAIAPAEWRKLVDIHYRLVELLTEP